MRFTKRSLEGIPVTGKRQIFYDDDLAGLAIRVGESGIISFYFVYRFGKGRGVLKKWLFIGRYPAMSPELARTRVREMIGLVAAGEDPAQKAQEARAVKLVKECLDTFFNEYVHVRLRPKTIELYDGLAKNHVKPALGKMKIEEVGHRDMARLHHSLKDKKYMANRVLAVCSRFFNWCEANGLRPRGSNPTLDIEPYKEEKKLDFLDADQLTTIGTALADLEKRGQVAPLAAAALRILVLTGARKREILSLKWEHLDLEGRTAQLFTTKTGFRVLQLPEAAADILTRLPRYGEYVFPSTSASGHLEDLRKPWSQVKVKAGLKGRWRIHDLRHAFASTAVNSGASLPMIGALLGHTQASTTARYAHVAVNPAHKLAEDTGARINAALTAAPSEGVIQFRPKAQGE